MLESVLAASSLSTTTASRLCSPPLSDCVRPRLLSQGGNAAQRWRSFSSCACLTEWRFQLKSCHLSSPCPPSLIFFFHLPLATTPPPCLTPPFRGHVVEFCSAAPGDPGMLQLCEYPAWGKTSKQAAASAPFFSIAPRSCQLVWKTVHGNTRK